MGKIKNAKKQMKGKQTGAKPADSPAKQQEKEQPSFNRKKLFKDDEFNVQTTG